MVSKENFARCLKSLRKEQSLSQADLGLKSGVDRSYIGRIERLEVTPGIGIMDKLAKALGTETGKMCDSQPTD